MATTMFLQDSLLPVEQLDLAKIGTVEKFGPAAIAIVIVVDDCLYIVREHEATLVNW